jgi:putative flippase GtrA
MVFTAVGAALLSVTLFNTYFINQKPFRTGRVFLWVVIYINGFAAIVAINYLCACFMLTLRNRILSIIDFFYPPFSRLMDKKTFHYAACGGGNTLLSIFIYFISYNFILNKQIMHLGVFAFKPHIAAFLISFLITFPIGFALSKYVVWRESNLKGRIQLFRYFLLVMICVVLNYIFLKLFVEYCHIYPTPAQIITTVIVVIFSYVTQKHFTFKVKEVVLEADRINAHR